jgi:hypothetical protein
VIGPTTPIYRLFKGCSRKMRHSEPDKQVTRVSVPLRLSLYLSSEANVICLSILRTLERIKISNFQVLSHKMWLETSNELRSTETPPWDLIKFQKATLHLSTYFRRQIFHGSGSFDSKYKTQFKSLHHTLLEISVIQQ